MVISFGKVGSARKPLLITYKVAKDWANKRSIFEHVTKTRKAVVTTLISSYPAQQNHHYRDEVHSELGIEDFFISKK